MALAVFSTAFISILASAGEHWPSWRGPLGNGFVPEGNPPIEWSDTKNIKWKVPIPGDSDSTPIVWGDRMFIQTAVLHEERPVPPREKGASRMTTPPKGVYRFNLVCLDRHSGEILWTRTANEGFPHEGHHPQSSFASYSPVTDGEHVWVSFGSRGLHCYDMDGNHVWSHDLIEMVIEGTFGEGSSPALSGDSIVVVSDHDGDSKIWAFDKRTGAVRWEKDRDEGSTWSTPLIVEHNGIRQVVTSGSKQIRSYDLANGDLLWTATGLTSAPIATPIAGKDRVYVATGYEGSAMLAIQLSGRGNLTGTDAIAWTAETGTPYISSQLIADDRIYSFHGIRAALTCFDANTGDMLYEKEKVEGLKAVYSSFIGVAGRLYVADRKGNVAVLKMGDSFEQLALNTLDDTLDASPVVIGDTLYLKGDKFLYCIEES